MSTTGPEIRVAVLGCGSIGQRHIRNTKELGYSVVAAFDPAAAVRDKASAAIGIPVMASAQEVFRSRPNVALICSPPSSHVELASMAVRNGCDVFVEKPLSHSVEGLDELIALAETSKRVTMVGCNMRFHPGPASIRRLIAEGVLGRVLAARVQTGSYLPSWRPQSDYRTSYSASAASGGGAVLDCIHEVDLALWYLGPCQLIAAAVQPATSISLQVDGLAEILLWHESGAISSIHLNFVQRDYRRGCQIIGETSTLYWDFGEPVIRIETGSGTEVMQLPSDWQINDMYVSELIHFFDSVRKRVETQNPLRQGREALLVALEARTKGIAVQEQRCLTSLQ